MQDVVGLAAAADPQFVRLRDNAREKIFKFLLTLQLLPLWRPRLRALASRLEEILFRKYPNKMEYHNMTRRPMSPTMMFAIKTYTAQNRQYRQNQQSLRQIASSHGYGAMNLTSNIMQGASENSRMFYVTGNVGPLSSTADMVLQNANMDTSLPGTDRFTEILPTHILIKQWINPTRHDLSGASNNNLLTHNLDTREANRFSGRPAPVKDLPREPKFTCPVCINELVDASSTICGHIFCKKCIEASIRFQKKCPTCRRRLTMRNFHRIYLPAMD
ncbi:unnamed protein product [Triticum turgidum subsp. durum]|uniref:RING-type domain-containing protein n=1 Tax=Triticum turgidum subsp. durum TaxID=4567 RepID=A0A9R0RVS2_TRITD|nr:unnamed protein product [Triticum turgidum subsp. durum]